MEIKKNEKNLIFSLTFLKKFGILRGLMVQENHFVIIKRSIKMKKLILIVICSLIVYGFLKVNEKLSDNMYADCIAAGKQSEDTCYKYAYLQ